MQLTSHQGSRCRAAIRWLFLTPCMLPLDSYNLTAATGLDQVPDLYMHHAPAMEKWQCLLTSLDCSDKSSPGALWSMASSLHPVKDKVLHAQALVYMIVVH